MWVLLARSPPPDAPYWPGRRWLAAVDALAWPGLALYWLSEFGGGGGLTFALAMALLVVVAGRRTVIALRANHRYHFTTWRLGVVAFWVVAIGILLKLGTYRD